MMLRPRSTTPAAPSDEVNQQIRALAPKLAGTELMSPAELEAYRIPLVARFLAHARANVDFYRGRLDFDVHSPEAISKHWSQIPILTRAEAVKHQDQLINRRTPADAGPITSGKTSGSTGVPLRYQTTAVFGIVNCALTERLFRWWRVDGNKPYAQISHTEPSRSREGQLSAGWHTARPKGPKYSLYHGFDIDTQLDWLLARRPAYLVSFAGIIKELAATTIRRGAELKFDLVFSAAAMLDAETRALTRTAFSAEIADTYGAQEAGYIAAQCPDCGEYHVSADAAVVEIVRDDGSSAEPGEIGRVIVTPLHNLAMPLLRYELGDYAEVGAADLACARKLPRLRRILGRYRNLFRFRDGTTKWPVSTAFYLHEFMPLKQFQMVQTDFENIEVRYVPEGAPGPVDLAALTERVRKVLGQPVNVTVHAVEKIERAATGKYEDCISLVASS